MNELTIFFVVLFFVLAIVTVIGHGIWVLLAHVFGGQSPSSRTPPMRAAPEDANWHACPRCGSPREPEQQVCPICNWPYASKPAADGMAALRALRRQLEVFGQQGLLDADARAQLNLAINEQEQRLLLAAPEADAPLAEVVDQTATIDSHPVAASTFVPVEGEPELAPAIEAQSSLTTSERAQNYAASRSAAISEALADPVAPVEPPKRREALSRIFAAFMEEKNIRWGELVGGLLIVGCSIALVISFWAQIAAQPLLKFVLFNGVTAALFGVGMYTDRRWKIHTTSHGILIIATLMVPLNFLAIAAFTQASPPTDLLSLSGEAISLVVFAMLVYFAGRIFVPADATLLAIAVIVPCLMQLLIRRFAGPTTPFVYVYALAAGPILTYLITSSVALWRHWAPVVSELGEATSLTELEANRALMFLGVTTAAALMAIALLLHVVPPLAITLHWLSPLVALCGLPAVLVGLLFWRRLVDRTYSGLQTTGIGVGALGALVMVGAVAYAWPDPATLLPAALLTAIAMLVVAVWFGIPAAHVPAGVALETGWIVGFYRLRGDVGWTLAETSAIRNLFLSVTTGHVLVALVAAFGLVAAGLNHWGRRESGKMYALLAAAATIASLALVFWFGFGRAGDPADATWTLAIYAIAAIAVAIRFDRRDAALVGSVLLIATLAQGIVFRWNPTWQLQQPWIVALLSHATLIGVGCIALRYATIRIKTSSAVDAADQLELLRVFVFSALVTSIVAALWTVATCYSSSATTLSIHAAWLAGVWLILAGLLASPVLFTAAQIDLALAIACGVTALVERHPWYTAARHPWLDPWFLEAQGIGLAAYCLVWSAIRWGIDRRCARSGGNDVAPQPGWMTTSVKILDSPWPAIDRITAIVVAALLAGVALYAVAPGAAQELSPTEVVGKRVVSPIEQFEIAGIAHRHAVDRGACMLLAAAAIALSVRLPTYFNDWRRIGMALLGMVVCLLLAPRWESEVATASALRWLSAVFFATAAVVSWMIERAGSKRQESRSAPTRSYAFRNLLIGFVVLIYIALAAYVGVSAFMRSTPDAGINRLWLWVCLWSVPIGLGAAALIVEASMGRRNAATNSTSLLHAWALQSRWIVLMMAIAPLAVLSMFIVAAHACSSAARGSRPGKLVSPRRV